MSKHISGFLNRPTTHVPPTTSLVSHSRSLAKRTIRKSVKKALLEPIESTPSTTPRSSFFFGFGAKLGLSVVGAAGAYWVYQNWTSSSSETIKRKVGEQLQQKDKDTLPSSQRKKKKEWFTFPSTQKKKQRTAQKRRLILVVSLVTFLIWFGNQAGGAPTADVIEGGGGDDGGGGGGNNDEGHDDGDHNGKSGDVGDGLGGEDDMKLDGSSRNNAESNEGKNQSFLGDLSANPKSAPRTPSSPQSTSRAPQRSISGSYEVWSSEYETHHGRSIGNSSVQHSRMLDVNDDDLSNNDLEYGASIFRRSLSTHQNPFAYEDGSEYGPSATPARRTLFRATSSPENSTISLFPRITGSPSLTGLGLSDSSISTPSSLDTLSLSSEDSPSSPNSLSSTGILVDNSITAISNAEPLSAILLAIHRRSSDEEYVDSEDSGGETDSDGSWEAIEN